MIGRVGELWIGLRAARVDRVVVDFASTVGLTALRAGAGDGAAFSLSACLPLPLLPLVTKSTVFGLLVPSLDFIGEGEVAFIERG